ncbi:MAG: hypothetical protein H0X41_01590, partial [Chitinophagaceae bacterium]|nr:hypothetical protein [Chitinophagaceae bacterium]
MNNKQTIQKIVAAFFAIMVAAHPMQAQFLKNIINNVKQTASARANDKAAQATNSAIDKA